MVKTKRFVSVSASLSQPIKVSNCTLRGPFVPSTLTRPTLWYPIKTRSYRPSKYSRKSGNRGRVWSGEVFEGSKWSQDPNLTLLEVSHFLSRPNSHNLCKGVTQYIKKSRTKEILARPIVHTIFFGPTLDILAFDPFRFNFFFFFLLLCFKESLEPEVIPMDVLDFFCHFYFYNNLEMICRSVKYNGDTDSMIFS